MVHRVRRVVEGELDGGVGARFKLLDDVFDAVPERPQRLVTGGRDGTVLCAPGCDVDVDVRLRLERLDDAFS